MKVRDWIKPFVRTPRNIVMETKTRFPNPIIPSGRIAFSIWKIRLSISHWYWTHLMAWHRICQCAWLVWYTRGWSSGSNWRWAWKESGNVWGNGPTKGE